MIARIYLLSGLILTAKNCQREIDNGAASGTLRVRAVSGRGLAARYTIPWSSIDRIVVDE